MADFDSKPNNMMKTVSQLGPVQKIAIGAAVLTLVAGFFVFSGSSGPTQAMAPVYTDLEPADAAAVTDELMTRNVDYELADGGRTIMVPKDDVYDLRIALSGEGLPSSNEGYALLDKQGITTSEFRQRIDYQRALEGELSRTLRSIEGVKSVTVHLALPEDSIFVDEPSHPTASVLVATIRPDSITADQVAAMVHLVAASVKDMQPSDVTIADAAGRVLTDGAGGTSGSGGVGQATDTYENELAAELRTMVGRVAGMDNVAINVDAQLDLTQRQETSEKFDTTDAEGVGVVVGERVNTETYTGTGGVIGGEAGVLGPDGAPIGGAGSGAAGGDSSYVKDDSERTYAVNRTVQQVTLAPGAVTRLSVAVLVDEASVSETQSVAIAEMVSTAAGIDPARGDQITVTRLPFSVPDAADLDATGTDAVAAAEAASEQASMIRTGLIALVVLVALILGYRSARKARREVSTPIDIGSLRSPSIDETMQLDAVPMSPSAHSSGSSLGALADPSQSALEELSVLADRNPEDVAQLLQDWLSDDKAMT